MYGSISTTALEFFDSYLDFTRCQRPDGTYYGTSGKCRKGKVSGKHEGSPVAGKTPKQPREEVSTKAKPLLSRRAGGQSLDGEKLDYAKLKQRVAAWVKKNGLGDSDDQVPGHDQTHILVQDYLGKSSKALGALMGERTKGGPTVFEEAVVEALQGFSSKPGLNKSIFFPAAARESFALSQSMDVLPRGHLYRRNPKRAIQLTTKYLEAISKRPDFDQFLSTLSFANEKAMEEM